MNLLLKSGQHRWHWIEYWTSKPQRTKKRPKVHWPYPHWPSLDQQDEHQLPKSKSPTLKTTKWTWNDKLQEEFEITQN